jgi:hypothetical protein
MLTPVGKPAKTGTQLGDSEKWSKSFPLSHFEGLFSKLSSCSLPMAHYAGRETSRTRRMSMDAGQESEGGEEEHNSAEEDSQGSDSEDEVRKSCTMNSLRYSL